MAMIKVSAAEFQRNIGRYQNLAPTQPVAVTHNGRERMVLISIDEYHRLKRRDLQVLGLADFTDADIGALGEIYGEQIDRVVLFGSRARRSPPNSDYDIAVFLKQLPDAWKERFRLAGLRVDFFDATGAFIDAKPYPTAAYRDRTPLMHEIRRDGLDL